MCAIVGEGGGNSHALASLCIHWNGKVPALRDRIAAAAASPSANTHAAMVAYDKACEHLRSDILRACELFPDTDALLAWLLNDIADDVLGEQDRISLALIIITTPYLQETHTCRMS